MNQTSYPLSWPISWPRTQRHKIGASRFGKGAWSAGNWRRGHSMESAVTSLVAEMKLLGVPDYNLILSTNIPTRVKDGLPYSGQKQPDDCGVAVYFKLKGKDCVLACDKWDRVECNVYAIAMHVEALRGQQRWGVGSVEQAFAGYTALPAPGDSGAQTWWAVLGVAPFASLDEAKAAYRERAKLAHPDSGGSNEAMARVNAAWDQARKAMGS